MNLHCVLTSNLLPLPDDLVLAQDFGVIEVVYRNDPKYTFAGQHVVVQGTSEDVRAWLRERATDYIWIGDGNPMMECFTLLHWCSDAVDPTQHGLNAYASEADFIRGRSPQEIGCTNTPGSSLMQLFNMVMEARLMDLLDDEATKYKELTNQMEQPQQRVRSKRSPTVSLKKMKRCVRR